MKLLNRRMILALSTLSLVACGHKSKKDKTPTGLDANPASYAAIKVELKNNTLNLASAVVEAYRVSLQNCAFSPAMTMDTSEANALPLKALLGDTGCKVALSMIKVDGIKYENINGGTDFQPTTASSSIVDVSIPLADVTVAITADSQATFNFTMIKSNDSSSDIKSNNEIKRSVIGESAPEYSDLTATFVGLNGATPTFDFELSCGASPCKEMEPTTKYYLVAKPESATKVFLDGLDWDKAGMSATVTGDLPASLKGRLPSPVSFAGNEQSFLVVIRGPLNAASQQYSYTYFEVTATIAQQ